MKINNNTSRIKLVIWGTGYKAEQCISCLDNNICMISFFIETHPTKAQQNGIQVLSPKELKETDYDYLIIASQFVTEIKEEIKKWHISLDNVIDWMDYSRHLDNYSEEIGTLFSDDSLKNVLLCKRWDEKEFAIDKKRYNNKYELIKQKKCIYVYDLRMHGLKLMAVRLIERILQSIEEDVGMLFIPDEKELDTVWYHNLLFQLDCYCFVLWEEMRLFYMGCRREYEDKFVFYRIGSLLDKQQFVREISASRYMNFEYCFEPSELQKKIDQAKQIVFCWMYSSRIGEAVRRVLELKNRPNKDNELIVIIPSEMGRTITLGANACFTELVSREFCMLRSESELWFWIKNIFQYPQKYLFHDDFITTVDNLYRIDGEHEVKVIDFYQNELLLGKELIQEKFGLSKLQYVCVCIRDSKYLTGALPFDDDHHNDVRNYDFNLFKQSIDFLDTVGLKTVRMGQSMKPIQYGKCIDFPNQGYDEFIDMMIHRHCKFVLSTDSGIGYVSPCIFGKPVACVWTVYPQTDAYINFKSEDLVIFSHYKDLNENRELSLYESMKWGHDVWWKEYGGWFECFRKNGMQVIPPSAEEICDLVAEMNSKLDGVWIEDAEDEKLMDIFERIVRELYKDERLELYAMPTVATTFLRRHREELLNMRV